MDELVEVRVLTLLFDNANQTPVLLLKEKKGSRVLPIWIGVFEAQSILMALKGIMLHRPLTHDLCLDIISSLGGKLKKVVINKIEKGTFYAELILEYKRNKVVVDARPSDSVAMALRNNVPIYVNKTVIEIASIPDEEHLDEKKWENILENIPDEAFGKYSM
ncbi:MAG: bifunctional nuclease family protein [Proteobacteria bacterium]|nr:bifunctional nuclease family protein [Pseudomonadota bacterium]